MKSSSGVMRKGCLWRPKNSRYIDNSCSAHCPESGEANHLIAAQQGFVWFVGIIAFTNGSKPEVSKQTLKTTVTLVQVSIMPEAGEPACVIVTWLLGIDFPRVQIKHLRPRAKTRSIAKQVSEYRVRELAKIASTRRWY